MSRIQNKIYKLLTELKNICEDNNIEYSLNGWCALSAVCNHALDEDVYVGDILVWAEDAKKLITAIEQKKNPHRKLDYLGNNSDFPGFFLRYADTESIAMEKHYYRGYQTDGISININFICNVLEDPKEEKKNASIINGLLFRHSRDDLLTKGEQKDKVQALEYLKTHTASALFDELIQCYSVENQSVFSRVTVKPRSSFLWTREQMKKQAQIVLGEETYCIPESTEEFVSLLYTKEYKERFYGGINYPSMFVDADCPYEKVFAEMTMDRDAYLRKNELAIAKRNVVWYTFSDYKKYIDKTWNNCEAMSKKINLQKIYDEKKILEIKEAWEEGDYRYVFELLEPWYDLESYLADNRIKKQEFVVNDQLESMIKEYHLERRG